MKFADYNNGDVVFRHGDVLLKKTNRRIVANKLTRDQKVLHSGQNHNHDIIGEFYFDSALSQKTYLGLGEGAKLMHPEHGEISIDSQDTNGTELEVDIQLEYDHFLEESRQVVD